MCDYCGAGSEVTVWTGQQWISTAAGNGLILTRDPAGRPAVKLSECPEQDRLLQRFWSGEDGCLEDVDVDEWWLAQQ